MEPPSRLYSRLHAAIPALLAVVLSSDARGADIRGAYYDGTRDEIVVEIAYRGTVPDHTFALQWESAIATKTSPTASSQG